MIVKNESKIITRLLQSVVGIVDTYCICDTGSTDNTKEIITNFFTAKGISGEIFSEPFQNFGYNRTVAMQRAAGKADYLLLLDADMVLVVMPDFKKEDLKEGAYQITQQGGTLLYYNTRLIKSTLGATCVGPTHEYYSIPHGYQTAKLPTLSIRDIGDGGAKSDKFERDIRLLKGGLETEPKNGRYMFYLANSYRDNGKKEEAIEWYKQRIAVGGWIEEIWNSAYHIGTCYKDLKKDADAIYWWLEAYNLRPSRAESIYQLVKHYRVTAKHALALQFYKIGSAISFPKDDVLFIEKDVYEYLFEYERLIFAYYAQYPVDHRSILKLIGNNYCNENVLSNYLFYAPKIKSIPKTAIHSFTRTVSREIGGALREFYSCNPSIVMEGEGYLMNLRMANHKITPTGGYAVGTMDNKIVTYNIQLRLDNQFKIIEETALDVPITDTQYLGCEDVRLLEGNKTLYAGMIQDPISKSLVMGHGVYGVDYTPCKSPNNRSCEKNWALFRSGEDIRFIYEWSPLTVLDLSGTIVSKNANVPSWFRHVRGSSCGVRWKNELWFLTHVVSHVHNAPRIYYHMIVVLNATTLEYIRNSHLFQFDGEKTVEYALGLIVNADSVIISYSKFDQEALVGVYPYGEFCFTIGL
jgi:glycosyltransferase involved in cell wall biosynthesis